MLKTFWTRFAIHRLVSEVRKHVQARMPILGITWFGAYWIHPRHLAIWVEVDTDEQCDVLLNDGTFMNKLRALPAQVSYPKAGRSDIFFGIASKETVDRECGGSWYLFYK